MRKQSVIPSHLTFDWTTQPKSRNVRLPKPNEFRAMNQSTPGVVDTTTILWSAQLLPVAWSSNAMVLDDSVGSSVVQALPTISEESELSTWVEQCTTLAQGYLLVWVPLEQLWLFLALVEFPANQCDDPGKQLRELRKSISLFSNEDRHLPIIEGLHLKFSYVGHQCIQWQVRHPANLVSNLVYNVSINTTT